MPPEILTEFKCVCCKSQDISCGIIRLGKIRFEFGSRIAGDDLQEGESVVRHKLEDSPKNGAETCVSGVVVAH
jgi:hypothetical protein